MNEGVVMKKDIIGVLACVLSLSLPIVAFAAVEKFYEHIPSTHEGEGIMLDVSEVGTLVEQYVDEEGNTIKTFAISGYENIRRWMEATGEAQKIDPSLVEEIFITDVIFPEQAVEIEEYIQPRAYTIHLRNIRSLSWVPPNGHHTRMGYAIHPGGTANVTVSRSVSSTLNAGVNLTWGFLTAQTGFQHANSVTLTQSHTVHVPQGSFAHIRSYPVFRRHTFDIFRRVGNVEGRIGTGTSEVAYSVRFVINILNISTPIF